MDEHFVPFLLVVVAPLAYFASRTGLLRRPALRGPLWALFVGLALSQFPFGGIDVPFRGRASLLICAFVTALLVLRQVRGPQELEPRRFRGMLGLAALMAVLTYTNFFSFHGGSWAHLHDVAHYYLGSKYSTEVGYGKLYVALLRAEQEEYGHSLVPRARDLSGNYLAPVGQLLAGSEEVKTRFTPERWSAFRADMRMFRETMGQGYGGVLEDHGYNPTPVWTLLGGFLANRVPAGSFAGVVLLTLLDPVLLAATFAAVAWAFGLESALLVAVYFCVSFGAAFDWVGGAFLRHLSFSAILLSACALSRSRDATAGMLLALAAALRVYPALLATGVVGHGIWEWRRTGTLPAGTRRFALGFTAALALFLSATFLRSEGVEHWRGFTRNISAHGQSVSSNVIGLTNWIAYAPGFRLDTEEGLERFASWRETAHRLQLATLFLLATLFVIVRSRQQDPVTAMGAGTLLVFTGLNLSAYYYTFLALLVLAYRDQPRQLAQLFLVELTVYAVGLFEAHEVMLYLYKSLLLLYLFLVLHLDAFREEAGRLRSALWASARPG